MKESNMESSRRGVRNVALALDNLDAWHNVHNVQYRNKESCKFENISWHNRYDGGGTIGIRIWHKRYSECGKNAERGKLGNAWST